MGATEINTGALECQLNMVDISPMAELLYLRSVVATAGHHGVVWKRSVATLARDIRNPRERIAELVNAGLWFEIDGAWTLEVERVARRCGRDGSDRWKLTEGLRTAVLERDGYRCQKCGTADGLVIDHVLAVARGGLTEFTNLQALCGSCNARKGTKPWVDFLAEP